MIFKMERFLRQIKSVSNEYRGETMRAEEQSLELSLQYRELKKDVQEKLIDQKPPGLSPRRPVDTGLHASTPRGIKTYTFARNRIKYNSTPQTMPIKRKRPQRLSANATFDEFPDIKEKPKEKKSDPQKTVTISFPDSIDNL